MACSKQANKKGITGSCYVNRAITGFFTCLQKRYELFPLHHWVEEKVMHYLATQRQKRQQRFLEKSGAVLHTTKDKHAVA